MPQRQKTPHIQLEGDRLRVDGQEFLLEGVEGVELREESALAGPSLVFVGGNAHLALALVAFCLDAPPFLWVGALVLGALLCGAALAATFQNPCVYALVLRRGEQEVVVARSAEAEPVLQALAALRAFFGR